jgi:hypothetical protein
LSDQMPETYDVQRIHTLLTEGFTADELRFFCQVTPEFQALAGELPAAIGEEELVDRMVERARAVPAYDQLLVWAQKHNPRVYEAHQPYAGAASPGTPSGVATAGADHAPGGVTIGDVKGGLDNVTIAGRDVRRTRIGQVILNILRGPTKEGLQYRNRLAMLQKVKGFWVQGVLEKSLHGLALIELGMAERADAIDTPFKMVLRSAEQSRVFSSAQTRIADVFDQMGRALLILGAPGSGKTTMLLELARATIARAEKDPGQPIPVVLNLSSWAFERKPVTDWLVDELKLKYQVPSKIGRGWVEDRTLLLLLDGLDEVNQDSREACVRALNEFSQGHGRRNIVVCSRVADYETLTGRLALHGAVLLQPLSAPQVDAYLAQGGEQLTAVRELLREDRALRELAQTPLMLSVMTVAYRGMPVQELRGLPSLRARRAHLFATYVDRMFKRLVRTKREPYLRGQTTAWLSWLAANMSEHAPSMFLIEAMQPSWLSTAAQQRKYATGTKLAIGLVWGLAYGLFGWAVAGVVGLAAALCLALMGTQRYGGLRDIVIGKGLRWSWPGLEVPLFFFALGLLVGGLWGGLKLGLAAGLIVGISFGLSMGIVTLIIAGRREVQLPASTRPNEGIWRSAKNTLLYMLAGLVIGGFMLLMFLLPELLDIDLWAMRQVPKWLPEWQIGSVRILGWGVKKQWFILVPLCMGLVVGLMQGGFSVIQHFVLRHILYRSGEAPWNLARFLDYAVERIFLRKVGGGYIFVHRLLMEYFASLAKGDAHD